MRAMSGATPPFRFTPGACACGMPHGRALWKKALARGARDSKSSNLSGRDKMASRGRGRA